MRKDGRKPDELRPSSMQLDYISQSMGSVLISTGRTRVICTASVEERTPPWLKKGGWITAEYAMLPGSTTPRAGRKPGGRGKEIQRLIGRSLRAAVDLTKLVGPNGGLSIICDCDVLEADGGTRTASITGAFVALQHCLTRLRAEGRLLHDPIIAPVTAVSVGIVKTTDGEARPLLDLPYEEDSRAIVDLNVVKRGENYVEIQGTGEDGTFDRAQLLAMLDLADKGLSQLGQLAASNLKQG